MPLNSDVVYWALPFLGLLAGSVMGMLVHRLPIMMEQEQEQKVQNHPRYNLWLPGSHCPNCLHPLAWYDNIPLLSWIYLKGRCRYCQGSVSWRYPALEGICAVAALLCGYWQPDNLALATAMFLYFWFALALSVIDFRTFLLPDRLTLPLLWLGLLFNTTTQTVALEDAVWGAAAGYSILWLLNKGVWLVARKEGLGYGDLKLLAATGAWCGWMSLPGVLLAASLSGLLYTLVRTLIYRQKSTIIAFGPFLAMAGFSYFTWYLG